MFSFSASLCFWFDRILTSFLSLLQTFSNHFSLACGLFAFIFVVFKFDNVAGHRIFCSACLLLGLYLHCCAEKEWRGIDLIGLEFLFDQLYLDMYLYCFVSICTCF